MSVVSLRYFDLLPSPVPLNSRVPNALVGKSKKSRLLELLCRLELRVKFSKMLVEFRFFVASTSCPAARPHEHKLDSLVVRFVLCFENFLFEMLLEKLGTRFGILFFEELLKVFEL